MQKRYVLVYTSNCNQQHQSVVEFGEAIKNPAYRILQTEYSGCLDISAHA